MDLSQLIQRNNSKNLHRFRIKTRRRQNLIRKRKRRKKQAQVPQTDQTKEDEIKED